MPNCGKTFQNRKTCRQMTNQHLRIAFSDLPSRARPLSGAELANVFGGCRQALFACSHQLDCCSLACRPAPPLGATVCFSKWV
jgi:hypothetical protein